jgi:hypothetical protein
LIDTSILIRLSNASDASHATPTCPYGPYSFGPSQNKNPCDTLHFWSHHPGGAQFFLVDGSVHFLPYSAAPIMPALASRAGGESVDLPF